MKPFLKREPYTGPVQAIILDWAGTTVDHGCRGPVAVFSRAFEQYGIVPTVEEVRGPMGKDKREHVQCMLHMDRIAALWKEEHGVLPDESVTDKIYSLVQELMPETLADYATPVPGWVEACNALKARGIKIGSCTGYTRDMVVRLEPRAAALGYVPDAFVTSDEVPVGRPWPWMAYLNCQRLGVHPLESCIKVGDTVADIEEGINAGMWVVGVTRTSNALGLTEEEAAAMPPAELAAREEAFAEVLRKAGALNGPGRLRQVKNGAGGSLRQAFARASRQGVNHLGGSWAARFVINISGIWRVCTFTC